MVNPQTTLILGALLLLSACCEYKHDSYKQIELYDKCLKVDQSLTIDYCERIAEEGSRIGECHY